MKSSRIKCNTFTKYFLSYIIILSVSLIGFLNVINITLKSEIQKSIINQNNIKLNNIENSLSDKILDLDRINLAVSNDTQLISSRFNLNDFNKYTGMTALKKYIFGNSFIFDIYYYIKDDDSIYNTKLGIDTLQDDGYLLHYNDTDYLIPIKDILKSSNNNYFLEFHDFSSTSPLIYVPKQYSSNFSLLFIIENSEIENILINTMTQEMEAIYLVDHNYNVIASINNFSTKTFTQYKNLISKNSNTSSIIAEDDTIINILDSNSLLGLKIISLSNTDLLASQVSKAKKRAYFIFIIILMTGLVITLISLYVNYLPIHRLKENIEKNLNKKNTNLNEIQFISNYLNDTIKENSLLINKINSYRESMQKSILEQIANNTTEFNNTSSFNAIDKFFDSPHENNLIIAKIVILDEKQQNPLHSVLNIIQKELYNNHSCLLIDNKLNEYNVLINLSSNIDNYKRYLTTIFTNLNKQIPCNIAISSRINNPMKIARIYEYSQKAFEFINSTSFIVFYEDIKEKLTNTNNIMYPYSLFDILSRQLADLDFENAILTTEKLFKLIDHDHTSEFFIRCILLDTTNLIINVINETNIKFNKFSDEYMEIVYLCRSTDYTVTLPSILNHLKNLISTLEKEFNKHDDEVTEMIDFVKINYTSYDFSVTLMADHFSVSASNMSFNFKKKVGCNLSDYVWNLRLIKAKELLTQSDLPVKEIIKEIGFTNISSFIRKFKSCEGITPIQYRNERIN